MAPNPDQQRFREVNMRLNQLREEAARIKEERNVLKREREELGTRLGKTPRGKGAKTKETA